MKPHSMNSAKGIQHGKRATEPARQFQFGVAPRQHVSTVQKKAHPVAPPAYRPQPVPKVLQARIAPAAQSNVMQAKAQGQPTPLPGASKLGLKERGSPALFQGAAGRLPHIANSIQSRKSNIFSPGLLIGKATRLNVLQRSKEAVEIAPKEAVEITPSVTTLSSQELIDSFEAAVKGWRFGVVCNTGHGGPTQDRKTRSDVDITKADLATAITTLKTKTYTTPKSKTLVYNHNATSSSDSGVHDIIFCEQGKEPGSGVESLNYHIKIH